MDRAQSQMVGVVLLTAIIALTISSTGAVVLNDWQSDLDQGPVADIDAEITPINITLEHRGGDTLYPGNTTIRLVGVEEGLTLTERFQPGGSLFRAYDRLEGRIELLVIHDPLNTVVYSKTQRIDNPVTGLVFEIANRTGPAYVFEGQPTNYTVDREFELGVSDPVTDRATVTVDDESVAEINNGESTIEVETAGSDPTATAEFNNDTGQTEIIVLPSDPSLNVETNTATAETPLSASLSGELTSVGGLPDVEVGVEYWRIVDRSFNRDPQDNGDKVIADGEFYDDKIPFGYTHDDDFVHDNTPFEPGENRTYTYRGTTNDPDIYGALRTSEQTTANRNVDGIDEVGGSNPYEEIYPDVSADETVNLTVRYAADGSAFYFSVDGTRVKTFDGLEAYEELYFSSYGGFDRGSATSLRITGIFERGDVMRDTVSSTVDSPITYNTTVDGLEHDESYGAQAYAQEEIDGRTVTDIGSVQQFNTSGPTAETLDAETHSPSSINASGKLTLGSAQQADFGFEYTPIREFLGNPYFDQDNIVAYGEYREASDDYTHDDGWIHDNSPLVNGSTRSYVYDNSDADADLFWAFRDRERTQPDRRLGDIRDDVYDAGGGNRGDNPLPNGRYRIEVSVSDDGQTADVRLYNKPTGGTLRYSFTDIDVSDHSELYFSSYEYYGTTNTANSLRLIRVFDGSDTEQVDAATGVTSDGVYSTTITGLETDREYAVAAVAHAEIDGTSVRDVGEPHRATTPGPSVDTLAGETETPVAINATADLVDLGAATRTTLGFEYTPLRTFVGNPYLDQDGITTYGTYREANTHYTHDDGWLHDNKPLTEGGTRSYIYDNSDSGADLRWSFRDRARTQRDQNTDDIRYNVYDAGGGNRNDHPLPDGRYRIEVSLSEDGDTADVRLYDAAAGGTLQYYYTDIDVSEHSELYFSTYEYYGTTNTANSLRLSYVFDETGTERVEATTAGSIGVYNTTVDGLVASREYAVTALVGPDVAAGNVTDTGEWTLLNTSGPSIEGVDAEPSDATAVNASVELVDLRTAQRTDLAFEHTPLRAFVGNPYLDQDGITTYGAYREAYTHYTHDDGWIHDNEPLTEGDTRTYIYDNSDSGADLRWSFRDRERTLRDQSTDDIRYNVYDAGGGDRNDHPLPDGTYRIEVSLSENGNTVDVRVYDELAGGQLRYNYSDIDVSAHSALYFSTYEYYGTSTTADSLRLTGVFDKNDIDRTEVDTGVTTEGVYNTTVDELDADRGYVFAPIANQTYPSGSVSTTAGWMQTETTGPTVETRSAEALGPSSINATGELVDLGSAKQTNLSFAYTPYRPFNLDRADNGDNVISWGDHRSGLTGYTLQGGWIHDNAPLAAGETRTYLLDNTDADLFWAFRDRERTQRDESVGDIRHDVYDAGGGDRDDNPLPDGRYRIEVTLSEDGDTADVRLYDALVGGNLRYNDSDIDVSAHSELYFSTYEYYGSSGDNSLRLTGILDESDTKQTVPITGVRTTGGYSTDITGLDADRPYAVVAVANYVDGRQNVTDLGDFVRVRTDAP